MKTDTADFKTVLPWLRAEGFFVLVLSVSLYWHSGASGWLFPLLLLVPDASMLLYLVSKRCGSLAYNLVHNYCFPLLCVLFGLYTRRHGFLPFVWIWTAHIGMDRALGYGLKHAGSFENTHLGRIGRAAPSEPQTGGHG